MSCGWVSKIPAQTEVKELVVIIEGGGMRSSEITKLNLPILDSIECFFAGVG